MSQRQYFSVVVSRYLHLKELLRNKIVLRHLLEELVDKEYVPVNTNTRRCKIVGKTMKHFLAMVNLRHSTLTFFRVVPHSQSCEWIGIILRSQSVSQRALIVVVLRPTFAMALPKELI